MDFTTKTTVERRGEIKIHDHLWLIYRDVNGRETMTIYDDHPNIGRSVAMSMGDVAALLNALQGFLHQRSMAVVLEKVENNAKEN